MLIGKTMKDALYTTIYGDINKDGVTAIVLHY